MLGIPLNKGDINEIHVVHWLALIHRSCSSNLQSAIWSRSYPCKHTKHTNCAIALREHHLLTQLRHAEKQQLYWNWQRYLCKILHFNRQNLMLISPP